MKGLKNRSDVAIGGVDFHARRKLHPPQLTIVFCIRRVYGQLVARVPRFIAFVTSKMQKEYGFCALKMEN
jgi:hypothetical protein